MKPTLFFAGLFVLVASGQAQIQVDLKLARLQYIPHEPVVAKLVITNLAGREIDLRNHRGQPWVGFEVTERGGQNIAAAARDRNAPNLKISAGGTVTQKINLTPLFSFRDFGTYRVCAHIYFADLDKFFYSPAKIFHVMEARPVWQRTVGGPGADATRTYSLLSNRSADHTTLYVRVESKDRGVVYATYPLGQVIAFDEPQAELDRDNRLHILHCVSPGSWAYSQVGLNGELLARTAFMESKTRPRLRHAADGTVLVMGGTVVAPAAKSANRARPNLSARPPEISENE